MFRIFTTREFDNDFNKLEESDKQRVRKIMKQLKEQGSTIYSKQNKRQQNQHEQELSKLYQRIGQLTTELDFLKKVVES